MRPLWSLISMNMLLPISRCAVMRPASETSRPSAKFERAASQASVGVNLLAKGLTPFARSAASLALRCSINEFVSSITNATGDETQIQHGCRYLRREGVQPRMGTDKHGWERGN